jgi:DnaK suppressor protein
MNAENLKYFRSVLLKERERLMLRSRVGADSVSDIQVDPDDLPDESDLAATEVQQNMIFRMRDREAKLLRAIQEALGRIEDGTYGICEETEEPIEIDRLKAIPWTTLSLAGAEIRERKRKVFSEAG